MGPGRARSARTHVSRPWRALRDRANALDGWLIDPPGPARYRPAAMSKPGNATRRAGPFLGDVRPVPLGAVDEFRAKGHTVLRGLARPDEVAAFRPAIEHAAARSTLETRPLEERDTYGKAFLQTGNLWRVDPQVAEFVFARRFAATAAELLGAEGVRLYHDQALIKEARGGPTPWHQDQFYWPLAPGQTVTMWMPLVDIDANVG